MKKSSGEFFRINFIRGLFIFICSIIVGRVVYLQIINSKYSDFLKNRYHNQITKNIEISGERGKIIDANGNILAITNEVESVYINPKQIKNKKRTAKILSALFNLDKRVILKKINSKRSFQWIKRKVSKDITNKLRNFSLNGVYYLKEFKRFYPYNSLASNLIGFCNIDGIGLSGIELAYDKYLKGKKHKISLFRDGRRQYTSFIPEKIYQDLKGYNVNLTIDFEMQSIVEKELKIWVESYKGKRGVVIVMEPKTGRILSMASYPDFNPNYYFKYNQRFFKNLAIAYNYEPGSTLKPLIVSWALNKRLIDLDWLYYCRKGYYRYRTLDVHDHEAMGWKTIEQILVHSSNIGMVRIADYLGKISIFNTLKDFGFGEVTGISLPGENRGIFPDIKRFSRITHATMSYGQGIAVTPLQLISAYSAMINGGFLMRPYVVSSIDKPDGEIFKKTLPLVRRKVLDEETSKKMREVLIKVVENGTGKKTKLSYIKIGGKTGTAQIPSKRKRGYLKGNYISSFIGFFPAENPKCIMLMIIERPKEKYYASDVVCPQFKKIAQEIMPYFGIKGEIKTVLHKENKKVKLGLTKIEVMRELKKKNIKKFKFIGTGFLEKREKQGDTIIFYFKS